MKKLLTLLLSASLMICCLGACSSEKSGESDNKKSEPTQEIIDKKPEPKQEIPEKIVNEDGVEFTPDIKNEGEIEKDSYDLSSDKIILNGKTYSFPVRISELQENGWDFTSELSEDEVKPGYTISLFSVSMEDEDGNILTLSELKNDSDDTISINDALLTRFSIPSNYGKNNVEFVLPGGISKKSTAYDVLSVYGLPNEDNENFDRAYNLKTQLSYEKQKKSEMRYSFSFEEDGKVSYVTISKNL